MFAQQPKDETKSKLSLCWNLRKPKDIVRKKGQSLLVSFFCIFLWYNWATQVSTSSQRHTLDSMTQWLLFYPTTPSTPRPRARHVFSACLLLICWSFGMPCSRVACRSGTALTYFPISTWTMVQRHVRRGSNGLIQEKHHTFQQWHHYLLSWKLHKLSLCK